MRIKAATLAVFSLLMYLGCDLPGTMPDESAKYYFANHTNETVYNTTVEKFLIRVRDDENVRYAEFYRNGKAMLYDGR